MMSQPPAVTGRHRMCPAVMRQCQLMSPRWGKQLTRQHTQAASARFQARRLLHGQGYQQQQQRQHAEAC